MNPLKKSNLAVAVIRAMTMDAAFTYRMGAGSPGEVNRTHPADIQPSKINTTNPPLQYGHACVVNTATNDVRGLLAGDTALTRIYGMVVRPYPTQQQSGGMSASLGVAVPPTSGVMDVLREGYGTVSVVGTPTKDGAVFIWVAADSGNHKQGGFEAAASAGNTAAIANARFNGPPDASGVTEVEFWKA